MRTININTILANTPYMDPGYDPSCDPPKIHVHQKHRSTVPWEKKNVAQRIPRRDVPVPTRISAVSYRLLFYSPKGQMDLQRKMDLNKWGGMYTIYTYINLNIKKGSLIDVSIYTYILCISILFDSNLVTCFHLAVVKKKQLALPILKITTSIIKKKSKPIQPMPRFSPRKKAFLRDYEL